jgi:hypothetical protein
VRRHYQDRLLDFPRLQPGRILGRTDVGLDAAASGEEMIGPPGGCGR